MPRSTLNFTFSSEVSNVKGVVFDILNFLRANCLDILSEDVLDLRLILSELILNAVIHGNKKNSEKSVCVLINLTECTICVTIKDEGAGFDYASVLAKEVSLEEECGRGIRLVNMLTDSISFNEFGNEVNFVKKVGQSG